MMEPDLERPSVAPAIGRHATSKFVRLAVLFAVVELLALTGEITYVEAERFERSAPIIAIRGPFRVGYVCGHHGCVPVWTYDHSGITSADPRLAPTARYWDPSLRRQLIGKMRRWPRQMLAEATIAAALALWWILFVPLALRRLAAAGGIGDPASGRMAIAGALAGMGTWAIILAPSAVLGYGIPRHTNQVGPGALGATVGGPPLLIGSGALAYRDLLQAASMLPLLLGACLEVLGVPLRLEHLTSIVAVLGFVIYGLVGAIWFARGH